MRRLTTRQRFAFIFTLYLFSFLVILYSLFFVVFSLMSSYQMRKDLSDDMTEIINNHLLLDNKQIIFRKDKTGASLRQFLQNEKASAIIIDINKTIIRSYGSFIYSETPQEFSQTILPIFDQVLKTKSLVEKQIVWNKENLETMYIPLKNNGSIIGILVLSKSMNDFFAMRKTMVTVFSFLGILSLTGSFIVRYFLARSTLTPLIKLSKIVEGMDLDKLETSLKVEGHPQDELVLLVKKFNEMILKLKDMTSRQKEFIANASHELKTPLTRAISSLEVLNLSENKTDEIKLVKEDLFHINDLLNKLLLLTQLQNNNKHSIKKQVINLQSLFKMIRNQFTSILEKKQITLSITNPETIQTDVPREYLEIIIANFVSNAIKYSESKKTIEVIVKKSDSYTDFTIKDHGIGMTYEETHHMFDRFYRGKTVSNKEKGYGIGLSIVKQICDIYNIDIHVTSRKERGTIVSFRIA